MRTPHPLTRLVAVAGLVLLVSACSSGIAEETDEAGTAVPETSAPAGADVIEGLPQWQPRRPIDTPRDDFAHVTVDDEIWVFGGMTGSRGSRLETTEVYDTSTNTWRYGPDLPEGLASFEGAAIGDKVYLFGGLDVEAEPSDFAAVLDTGTGQWQELPPLPHPRYAHDVAEVDGRIYVVGGDDSDGQQAAVDVFDPKTNTWSRGAPMPHARSSIDLAPVDGTLYVIGGWLGSGPTSKVQTYDPASDSWSESTPMPRPMSRGGAAAVNGKIYVSYHEWSSMYDVSAGTWSPANPMTVPRHGLGYIAVGERIYGIGGCTEHPLRDVAFVDVLDVSGV